jgi:5-methylcytosine-specific restriction endonuclease McrA
MADGHLGKCAACVLVCVKQWRSENPNARKAESAAARVRNGGMTRAEYLAKIKDGAVGRRASALKYYRANKEKQAAWNKQDRALYPEKYATRSAAIKSAKRAQRDPAFLSQNCATENRRRAAKAMRIPLWADHDAIGGMYEVARLFRQIGIQMEVDHVVPLQGKTVSGLHTHDNLQLLVKSQNAAKHNRYWPDSP